MKKDKLINKIKNLLDLADDKNSRHEAEAAAKKAHALIMKYNVDEAELNQKESTIDDFLYELEELKGSHDGTWLRQLFHTVAKFNFCKVIVRRYGKNLRKERLVIIGKPENVELVKHLSEQLVYRIRSIEEQEWGKYCEGYDREYADSNWAPKKDSRGVFLRSFSKGAVHGLWQQFEEQQEKFMGDQSTAIVLSRSEKALDEYSRNEFGRLKKARGGNTTSTNGYFKGKKHGKNMNINSGLRGKNGNRLLK